MKTLQSTLGLTVFLVTHDLESLYAVCDRIAVLAEGKVVAQGTIEAMLANRHPWVESYFRGRRGSMLAQQAGIKQAGQKQAGKANRGAARSAATRGPTR
jgi:phospholipid/cholesterol/gamma-HCH transport system ATP-binding protein